MAGREGRSQTVNVLTRNYDNQRSGANLAETALRASNVNSAQFGKLFALPVDDQIFAGVLYKSGLSIAGGTHNVIFVATVNNTVYAFDADTFGSPLWQRNFNGTGRPSANAELGQACAVYRDFRGNIGIVGTPVIDGSTNTMYFVTRTVEGTATIQRLRAIDITTGNDRAGSPVAIQASVAGTGEGGSTIAFNPVTHNQRPALALSQGQVYIAWASYCDTPPYHGWVMTFNATTLALTAAFNTTPNGSQSGIWMAGAGPAFDGSGNAYFSTGNGDFNGSTAFGESLLKLAPATLLRLDYFTASNYTALNASDKDFGSGGPSIVPGTSLLVTGGKEGKVYLLDTNNLGQLVSGDIQIPQVFQAVDPTARPTATHHVHGSSPMWNSPAGLNLYIWGENDFLHSYRFNPSTSSFNVTPVASGSILPPVGMPGGVMALSANGSQTGSGILWSTLPRNGDANLYTVPGNLYAFNAETLALLWSSTGTDDDMYNMAKGSPPVVVNGKVYVASLSKIVSVYGLRTNPPPSQNLALNKAATSTTTCNAAENAGKAVNGSYSQGVDDKWCSSVASPYLQLDLGAPMSIARFVVEHAGAGGEDFGLNTVAFNIQISNDGTAFSTVVNVTGNADSITTHDIAAVTARYVRLNVITPTNVGDPAARIYEFEVFGSTVAVPDFSLSAIPSSVTVAPGLSAAITVTAGAQNGFGGTIGLAASGLPAGATAVFTPPTITGSGTSRLVITTTAATPLGSSTITITATSGATQHTAALALAVVKPAPSTVVNLSSAYNRMGIVTDGKTFTTGGLDGSGHAYSVNLLGTAVISNGSAFALGPADSLNTVSSATVALPPVHVASLNLLATGVNGNQTAQTFQVVYTDGTSASFTQSLSDWAAAQNFPGETVATTLAYRDTASGTIDHRPFYLFSYSFSLNKAKTVKSLILPANSNVVVLSVSLTPMLQVPLTSVTRMGFVTDGTRFAAAGGLNGAGFAYSANLLGPTITSNGVAYLLAQPNGPNVASGGTISIPNARYSSLRLLATAVNGNQTAQALTVRYSDGSTSVFTQNFSDWLAVTTYARQSTALSMAYRNASGGTKDNRACYVYAYSFPLNPAKAVTSITLPANGNVVVLAVTMGQ